MEQAVSYASFAAAKYWRWIPPGAACNKELAISWSLGYLARECWYQWSSRLFPRIETNKAPDLQDLPGVFEMLPPKNVMRRVLGLDPRGHRVELTALVGINSGLWVASYLNWHPINPVISRVISTALRFLYLVSAALVINIFHLSSIKWLLSTVCRHLN